MLHLYLVALGILFATLLGLMFAALFMLTGSIAAPIALHALVDLRTLVLIPFVVGGVWRLPTHDNRLSDLAWSVTSASPASPSRSPNPTARFPLYQNVLGLTRRCALPGLVMLAGPRTTSRSCCTSAHPTPGDASIAPSFRVDDVDAAAADALLAGATVIEACRPGLGDRQSVLHDVDRQSSAWWRRSRGRAIGFAREGRTQLSRRGLKLVWIAQDSPRVGRFRCARPGCRRRDRARRCPGLSRSPGRARAR